MPTLFTAAKVSYSKSLLFLLISEDMQQKSNTHVIKEGIFLISPRIKIIVFLIIKLLKITKFS